MLPCLFTLYRCWFSCCPTQQIISTLPRDWVKANMVPVYKKRDSHLSSNYCPISLTFNVIKVMERILHRQLAKALESHSRISNFQHSFQARRSTFSLLLSAIHNCFERHHSVHCIFFNLARAFDSVPRSRLLLKLKCLGINHDFYAMAEVLPYQEVSEG